MVLASDVSKLELKRGSMANDHLQSTVEGAMNTIRTDGDDQGLNMLPSIDFTSITHDG